MFLENLMSFIYLFTYLRFNYDAVSISRHIILNGRIDGELSRSEDMEFWGKPRKPESRLSWVFRPRFEQKSFRISASNLTDWGSLLCHESWVDKYKENVCRYLSVGVITQFP